MGHYSGNNDLKLVINFSNISPTMHLISKQNIWDCNESYTRVFVVIFAVINYCFLVISL